MIQINFFLGEETDTLLHLNDATHIVVLHKGRYFRLCCYNKGRLLNSAELQKQIQGILEDPSEPDDGETHLGSKKIINKFHISNSKIQRL